MMRYANWDLVCGALDDGDTTPFGAWSRREGPREVARRMDACRVDDGTGGEPTWLVTEETIQNGRNPSADPRNWGRSTTWPHPESAAMFVRFLAVGEARAFPFIADAVVADLELVRDWYQVAFRIGRHELPSNSVANEVTDPAERADVIVARRTVRRLPHMSFAEAKAAGEADVVCGDR